MTKGDRADTGSTTWDLFCRVVDNYGDIGIAWRLAKQLAVDEGRVVRLFVDGLDAFARIEPRVQEVADVQVVERIAIAAWPDADPLVADVVLEVLGCGLPVRYLDAMATGRPPVWIDFEHLSAEEWVPGFHAMPSPHPTLPLTKHFFYPGFGPDTGGLLIEPGYAPRRARFVESVDATAAMWRQLGVPPPDEDERRLSLFAYPDAPVVPLLCALADDADRRWTVVVPGGLATSRSKIPSAVSVIDVPFTDQDAFDRLLWACDVNCVRGEDSFVRAQPAGRPMVWQIYRQADAAHLRKLDAFETLHEATMDERTRAAQRAFWLAWNERSDDLRDAARCWLAALPALRSHADDWATRITAASPLIERLEGFVAARRAAPSHRPVC